MHIGINFLWNSNSDLTIPNDQAWQKFVHVIKQIAARELIHGLPNISFILGPKDFIHIFVPQHQAKHTIRRLKEKIKHAITLRENNTVTAVAFDVPSMEHVRLYVMHKEK